MYYKMRILPVIFLFSMMTKAQDNFILGFLIHGVNLILNKGMTGIWIARRYKFVAKTHTLACGMKATFYLTYT